MRTILHVQTINVKQNFQANSKPECQFWNKRKTKPQGFLLYGQSCPTYRYSFKFFVFGHETCQLKERLQMLHV